VVRFWLAYSGRPEAFADKVEARTAAGYRALGAMEAHLAEGREWLVGGGMTLGDIALYAYTHVAHEGGFELARYPAGQAWLARVAAEPGHVPIDA
jgi:glutathione S-transferase